MAAREGTSDPRRVGALGVVLVLTVLAVRRIRIAAGMRRGDRAVIDAKRARNKRFNKLVMTVGRAGRPHSIFAVIHYTGRRSGRHYAAPIRVVEQADGFIVPLTYGPRTSWYVNLQSKPGPPRHGSPTRSTGWAVCAASPL